MTAPETFKDVLYNMRYFVDKGDEIMAERGLTHDEQRVRLEKLSDQCYLNV